MARCRARQSARGWVSLVAIAWLLLACASPDPTVRLSRFTFVAPNRDARVIVLPTHFEGLPEQPSQYELRTSAALPEPLRGQELQLAIPYFSGRTELWIDDRRIPEDNPPAFAEPIQSPGPHSWTIPAELTGAPELDIRFVVAHRWTQSAWFDTFPRLGLAKNREPMLEAVRATNSVVAAISAAVLIQISVLYLVVFLADRRRRAHLAFAIQATAVTGYHFFVLGLSQHVFGGFEVSFLGIALATATLSAIHFTHALLELPPPSKLWLGLFGLNVLAALVRCTPFTSTTTVGPVAATSVLIVIVYQVTTCARIVARPSAPDGARLLLLSWLTLLATAWNDSAVWFGAGEILGGLRIACPGLALFALLQSVQLGREHLRTLARTDELNVELSARVDLLEAQKREIQGLNEELRRKIADRSRQVFQALSLLQGRGARAPALRTGDVVDGRYRIIRSLGRGGAGIVYEVERTSDQKHLALKVTRGLDSATLARLAKEAEIVAQLAHPNVVAILDVDVAPAGFVYLVMELVRGKSLAELKDRFGDLPFALEVLRQIATALTELHRSGVIHRDLKPANVLVADRPDGKVDVRVTDFGISYLQPQEASERAEARGAELSGETPSPISEPTPETLPGSISPSSEDERLTLVGATVGTPSYMAPEQVGRGEVTSKADIFSLGLVAYEIITRRKPFQEPYALARARGRDLPPPPPLRELVPALDAAIAELVERAMNPEPAARPTAMAMSDALKTATSAGRRSA